MSDLIGTVWRNKKKPELVARVVAVRDNGEKIYLRNSATNRLFSTSKATFRWRYQRDGHSDLELKKIRNEAVRHMGKELFSTRQALGDDKWFALKSAVYKALDAAERHSAQTGHTQLQISTAAHDERKAQRNLK